MTDDNLFEEVGTIGLLLMFFLLVINILRLLKQKPPPPGPPIRQQLQLGPANVDEEPPPPDYVNPNTILYLLLELANILLDKLRQNVESDLEQNEKKRRPAPELLESNEEQNKVRDKLEEDRRKADNQTDTKPRDPEPTSSDATGEEKKVRDQLEEGRRKADNQDTKPREPDPTSEDATGEEKKVRNQLEEGRRKAGNQDTKPREPEPNSSTVTNEENKSRDILEETRRKTGSENLQKSPPREQIPNSSDITKNQANIVVTLEEKRRTLGNENLIKTESAPVNTQINTLQKNIRDNIENIRRKFSNKYNRGKRTVFSREPSISSVRILQMSEGRVKRFKDGRINADNPGRKRFNFLTSSVYGQRKPSKNFATSPTGRESLSRVINSLIRKSRTRQGLPNEGVVKVLINRSLLRAGKAAVKFGKIGLAALDFADDLLDIAQLAGDSLFYGKFPQSSNLITASDLRNVVSFSVDRQIQAVIDFNTEADTLNLLHSTMSTSQKEKDYGYPYRYSKYPMIMGPLDVYDSANAKGDSYWVETRVNTEIDAIREIELRTPTSIFAINLRKLIEDDVYTAAIADTNIPLTYFADEVFGQTLSDDLYRYAFTYICNQNNGTVYEDVYTEQRDSNGELVLPTYARFQCGYRDSIICKAAGNKWFSDPVTDILGHYAEWYAISDLNTIINALVPTRPDIDGIKSYTSTTSNGKPVNAQSASAACIVTNSGVRKMCNSQSAYIQDKTGMTEGKYDPDIHTCEFSAQYCRRLGTCFDSSTKSCYMPTSIGMQAAESMYGQGGVQEWISINGCEFVSGKNTLQDAKNVIDVIPLGMLFTGTGGKMLDDMCKNHKNWNEGTKELLKQPTNAVVFTAIITTAATGATYVAASALGAAAVASAATGVGVILAAALMIAMAGTMASDIINDKVESGLKSPYGTNTDKTAIAEYTCTGWQRDPADPFRSRFLIGKTGHKLPKNVTFVQGWVTKPILSKTGSVFNDSSAQTISQIYGTVENTFFSDKDTRLIKLLQDQQSQTDIGPLIRQYLGYPGFYEGTNRDYVTKKFCSKDFSTVMWRSGSRSSANQLWCLPEQPPASWADPDIGPLAKIVQPITLSSGIVRRKEPSVNLYLISNVVVSGTNQITSGLFLTNFPCGGQSIIHSLQGKNIFKEWSFYVQSTGEVLPPRVTENADHIICPPGWKQETVGSCVNQSCPDGYFYSGLVCWPNGSDPLMPSKVPRLRSCSDFGDGLDDDKTSCWRRPVWSSCVSKTPNWWPLGGGECVAGLTKTVMVADVTDREYCPPGYTHVAGSCTAYSVIKEIETLYDVGVCPYPNQVKRSAYDDCVCKTGYYRTLPGFGHDVCYKPPVFSHPGWCSAGGTGYSIPTMQAYLDDSEVAKNRSWTDGTDITAPNFPDGATYATDRRLDRPNDIFYQLVYDRSIFASQCVCSATETKDTENNVCISSAFKEPPYTPVGDFCSVLSHTLIELEVGSTCLQCPDGYHAETTAGSTVPAGYTQIPSSQVSVGCKKSCLTLPTLLFDDTKLLKYFSMSTINSARREMCQEQLLNDPTGKNVDSKCWGYLSIAFTGFKFLPMTIPASSSR